MNGNTKAGLEALGTVLEGLTDLHESMLTAVVPEEARRHFRSSRREALLGLRAMLDRSIDRLDEQANSDPHPPTAKPTSRSIEISE
jgi:hypothetical protein